MTALEYLHEHLKEFPYLHSTEGDKLNKPSNSELKRWLMKASVIINGVRPKPWDTIEYPITELVFFPKSKYRCTVMLPDKFEKASDLIKRYYTW